MICERENASKGCLWITRRCLSGIRKSGPARRLFQMVHLRPRLATIARASRCSRKVGKGNRDRWSVLRIADASSPAPQPRKPVAERRMARHAGLAGRKQADGRWQKPLEALRQSPVSPMPFVAPEITAQNRLTNRPRSASAACRPHVRGVDFGHFTVLPQGALPGGTCANPDQPPKTMRSRSREPTKSRKARSFLGIWRFAE